MELLQAIGIRAVVEAPHVLRMNCARREQTLARRCVASVQRIKCARSAREDSFNKKVVQTMDYGFLDEDRFPPGKA